MFQRHETFQKYINKAAQIKGTWRDDGKWNNQKLADLYNSVKDMFDFDAVSTRNRKYKLFEQQIWKMIYRKLKKKSPIGWGRTMRVMYIKDCITF